MKLANAKKNYILGVVLLSAIMGAGIHNASAGPWGGGPNRWNGPQCGECDRSGYSGQPQLDEKSTEAHDTFRSETVALRKEIATKKAEKKALMLNDNPDAKRIAQLTGELFDLREQLHTKAQEKGIDINNIGYGRHPGLRCGGPGPRGFQDQL